MRPFCFRCLKSQNTCYCADLQAFESGPLFSILTHPREARNRIATGRMLHRSLLNSRFEIDIAFDDVLGVRSILEDPSLFPVLLYPGPEALDLGKASKATASGFLQIPQKRPAIFVIDGTWDLARGMIRRSPRLRSLPRIAFQPATPSRYEIRQQPASFCYSTLEAVHWILVRFDELGVFPAPPEPLANLLVIFERMVQQQLRFENERSHARLHPLRNVDPQQPQGMDQGRVREPAQS